MREIIKLSFTNYTHQRVGITINLLVFIALLFIMIGQVVA